MSERVTARAWPEIGIGIGMLAFAGAVLWQVYEIPSSPLYAKVGPSIFPFFTAGALAVMGLLVLFEALRGGWQLEEEKEVPVDWKALLFVVAGLVANVALIDYFGFTVSSTVLFVLVAHAFGSRAL
ncbi:MAG: tripartite tricarboxylate transporter TctB family protein, partial [Rhizobiales bacterium]|nr:tripartite tricarboxylate transporter TctB family protein [Hyphomicrobiales bacterium]